MRIIEYSQRYFFGGSLRSGRNSLGIRPTKKASEGALKVSALGEGEATVSGQRIVEEETSHGTRRSLEYRVESSVLSKSYLAEGCEETFSPPKKKLHKRGPFGDNSLGQVLKCSRIILNPAGRTSQGTLVQPGRNPGRDSVLILRFPLQRAWGDRGVLLTLAKRGQTEPLGFKEKSRHMAFLTRYKSGNKEYPY